jgi:DNA-binding beta-propeller fold protein YncE
MTSTRTLLLIAASLSAYAQPQLTPVGTYDTLLGASGAEIVSVREKDSLGAITNIAGSVDLLDVSDPGAITLIRRVTVPAALGTPNSVALHPTQDYFLVVSGSASRTGQTGFVTAFRISTGALLRSDSVGIQPDSVAISPNGKYAVVANEAEGLDPAPRHNGGEGSLTLIRLNNFNPRFPSPLEIQQIPLLTAAGTPGFSAGRTDDLARMAITNAPETLEPESVAFSHDSKYAYITLQENNGVAKLNLKTQVVTYFGLGQTTHLADVSTSGGYNPITSLTSFREPDGIALFSLSNDEEDENDEDDNTVRYFVTADEGDSRNDLGASGVRGGRTVSVFNASTGAFVGDTGKQLDDAAAAAGKYDDARSNRGGSEPEVLDVAKFKGRTLVAVGLERAAAVALIDVTDPAAPTVIDLDSSGNNPEGVKFIKVKGTLYVLAANEASGTVSAFRVE